MSGKSSKRSRLDGLFQVTKTSKDRPVQTRIQNLKFVPITSGSANSKGVVEFEYTSGANEWFRLAPAPFFVDYQIAISNLDKKDPPAAGTDGKIDYKIDPPTVPIGYPVTKDYLYHDEVQVMSQTVKKGHGCFLPPEMGFGCFYTHVEVYIDGMKIGDESDMMGQNKVYQNFNRIYATPKARAKTNQVVVDKNIKGRKTPKVVGVKTDGTTNSAEIKEVRSETQLLLGRLTATESYEDNLKLTDHFTLDGNFAVSPPFCNALSILRGTDASNENGFLPPGTTITLRLHKRNPLYSMLQTFDGNFEDMYEKNSAPAATKADKSKTKLHIVNLSLMIESKILPDAVSSRQLSRTLNYPFNRIQMDIGNVDAGHQQMVVRSRVPAGAKAAFVTFMKEEHLWYNGHSKKSVTNFFHFPQNLQSLNFSLTDHGVVLSKGGLASLSKVDRNYSPELRNYYSNMISGKGLTDITFDEMFPKGSDKELEPLTQSIFIDMQNYYISDHTRMEITSQYTGSLSPTNTKLVVCYVLDMNLKRSPAGRWTLESVV